jgi:hypothetical protein
MSIMNLSRSDAIAQPSSDLENAGSLHHEQAGEGVAHDVGSNPRNPLPCHVVAEGLREVVTVDALSLPNIGPEHERLAQPVPIQKQPKRLAEWDFAAAFLVVKPEGGCVAQVDSVGQEPTWDGLNNLVLTQTGMETAVQDESQILTRTFSNQSVSQFALTKEDAGGSRSWNGFDVNCRVAPDLAFLNGPAKERANGHQELVRGRVARFLKDGIVLGLQQRCIDRRERCASREAQDPAAQFPELIFSRGARVLAAFRALLQMCADFGQKRRARVEQRNGSDLGGGRNRFLNITSLKADHRRPNVVRLRRLVVPSAATEEQTAQRIDRHAALYCSSRDSLQGDVKGVYQSGDARRQRDGALALSRPEREFNSPMRRQKTAALKLQHIVPNGLSAFLHRESAEIGANGDHFIADGLRYYRCFANGRVIPSIVDFEECPECNRQIIDPTEHGDVPVKTVRFAILKGDIFGEGSRIELPSLL